MTGNDVARTQTSRASVRGIERGVCEQLRVGRMHVPDSARITQHPSRSMAVARSAKTTPVAAANADTLYVRSESTLGRVRLSALDSVTVALLFAGGADDRRL